MSISGVQQISEPREQDLFMRTNINYTYVHILLLKTEHYRHQETIKNRVTEQ